MASSTKKSIRSSRYEGLKQLERILRMSDTSTPSSLWDAILVSIDLEVSREERTTTQNDASHIPRIKEFGMASLDIRDIFHHDWALSSPPNAEKRIILTRQFSTSNASKDYEDCDITDFRECVFAETLRISEGSVPTIVSSSLQFQDDQAIKSSLLRNIVIVGHSPASDIKILERLGVDIASIAPVIAVMDTHSLSHRILGPDSPATISRPAIHRFSLGAVLTELGCPYHPWDLHNAGNDATYTLHAMLMMALRWAETKALSEDLSTNVERLRAFAGAELNEDLRWTPIRKALGAHRLLGPSGAEDAGHPNLLEDAESVGGNGQGVQG